MEATVRKTRSIAVVQHDTHAVLPSDLIVHVGAYVHPTARKSFVVTLWMEFCVHKALNQMFVGTLKGLKISLLNNSS